MESADLAAYFQVDPAILRFVPELLQDLDALGSDPELVVAWLDEAGLRGPRTRVLDLGCGKGAVAVTGLWLGYAAVNRRLSGTGL